MTPKFRRCCSWLVALWFGCTLQLALAGPLLLPLTTEQGLSRDTIQQLYLDNEGLLWVATASGLNIYDGSRVQQVMPDNQQFNNLSFFKVFEDPQQRLWAAASNVGLYLLNKASGKAELVLDLAAHAELVAPIFNTVISEDANHLLVGINRAVYRFSLQDHSLVKLFEFELANSILGRIRVLQKVDQKLLIGTSRGLYLYDLAKAQSWPLPLTVSGDSRSAYMVRDIAIQNEHIWVAQGDRLFQFNLQDPALEQAQAPQVKVLQTGLFVTQILPQSDQILLASTQGLYQLVQHQADPLLLWRFSQSSHEVGQDLITAIVATPDGGYWFGSREDGAYYWHPRSTHFQNVQISNSNANLSTLGMNDRSASAFWQQSASQFWIGSGSGLKSLDLSQGLLSEHPLPNPLPAEFSANVVRIYPFQSELIWLRSVSTMKLYNPRQQQFVAPPLQDTTQLSTIENGVRGHWQDPTGAFWFYNNDNFYYYQPHSGEVKVLPGILQQIPIQKAGRFLGQLPTDPSTMVLSAVDQIWLYQTTSGQMSKLFEASPYLPGLDRFADRMCVDQQQQLWFTFSGLGLLSFNSQTLQLKNQLDTGNGLLSNKLFSCETDQFGQLWFAGNYGLARLDPATLHLEYFNKKDGLLSNEFIAGASTRLQSGQLVFGSNRGLTLFDPAALQEPAKAPDIAISAIRALNQPAFSGFGNIAGKHFTFNHQAHGFEILFSSLSFRDSNKILYKFWLEGDQQIDFPQQYAPNVVFPQLDAGQYWFNVMAISPMTGLNSAVARIKITITPPPWYSPLALASYAILILMLTLMWLHNRLQQKRQLAHAHFTVKASELRLKQALEAVQSGVWEWHSKKNSIYAHRVHAMLGYNKDLDPLSLEQHLKLVHPDDKDSYQQAWQRFIHSPEKTFDHTYRLQHKAGHWLWFRDIGKITSMQGGNAERVIGTYSNITETRATKEKARLFGEAFQQTRDWVVLLDPEQKVIAANLSFTEVFGNMDDYLNQPRSHDLGISRRRRRYYSRLLADMQPEQHWQGEELILSPDGTERPALINISAVGENQQVEFFVLVFTDITAQKQAEENLRFLANYDALTGLPNRALLMDRILHGIEQAKREQRSLALCFIDLDKFKQINDSLGHNIGDLLLKEVAKRLTATLRLTDTVARLGGDEFVVLLESYKNDDNVSHVARKIIKAIGEPMQLAGQSVSVSPSIGIALYPEDAADATELLKHADVAMYHAKDSGRNNFQFFMQQMNEKAQMQLERETRLRAGWLHKEFINHYQPIYDSRQQQMVGVEVLMRWQTKDKLIGPIEFIALAEDLRLIEPMTLDLLSRALSDVKIWHQAGFPLYISVNLSPTHLEQPQLATEVAALLAQYELPASCLRFEVTESALMQDHQSAIASMLALNQLGVQLALDDFGTGYSSLKYLKELPIDAIKIDRSFVQDIGIDRDDETIIDAMLSMARSLGMYCIAEGVETEQQLEFFSVRQCYFIQGYLFGRPMAAAALLAQLQSDKQQD